MALLAQVSTQKLITNTIQSDFLSVNDKYGTPTTITTGFLGFLTSSSQESYALALNPFITGSISSLGLIYSDSLTADAGSLYISSLYLGNLGGTTSGTLTTDATATDLFWKGSKLNDQGGGGITAAQLTSTATRWATYPAVSSIVFANAVDLTRNEIVSPGGTLFNLVTDTTVLITTSTNVDGITPLRGLAASQLSISDQINFTTLEGANYTYNVAAGESYTGTVSSLVILDSNFAPGPLYLSSLYFGNQGGTVTGNLTTDSTASNLFWNGSQLMTNRVKIVVSTLGTDTMYINESDIAIRFILNGSNCPQDILLPDISAAGDGWNVKIQQPGGFFNSLSVYDFSSNVLFTVNSGQLYDVVTDGTTWYYTYSTQ
jgi:hypothetical protein